MAPNIATSTRVSLDELLDFVRPRHRALLLTRRADGGPQASPLTCGVDDSGRIVVSTYPERAKTRNARRDPRVSVLVLSDEWNGPWVQIQGSAEVVDVPDEVRAPCAEPDLADPDRQSFHTFSLTMPFVALRKSTITFPRRTMSA